MSSLKGIVNKRESFNVSQKRITLRFWWLAFLNRTRNTVGFNEPSLSVSSKQVTMEGKFRVANSTKTRYRRRRRHRCRHCRRRRHRCRRRRCCCLEQADTRYWIFKPSSNLGHPFICWGDGRKKARSCTIHNNTYCKMLSYKHFPTTNWRRFLELLLPFVDESPLTINCVVQCEQMSWEKVA